MFDVYDLTDVANRLDLFYMYRYSKSKSSSSQPLRVALQVFQPSRAIAIINDLTHELTKINFIVANTHDSTHDNCSNDNDRSSLRLHKRITLCLLSTSTQSCCPDELGASHYNCHCILLFGHGCTSCASNIPSLVVPERVLIRSRCRAYGIWEESKNISSSTSSTIEEEDYNNLGILSEEQEEVYHSLVAKLEGLAASSLYNKSRTVLFYEKDLENYESLFVKYLRPDFIYSTYGRSSKECTSSSFGSNFLNYDSRTGNNMILHPRIEKVQISCSGFRCRNFSGVQSGSRLQDIESAGGKVNEINAGEISTRLRNQNALSLFGCNFFRLFEQTYENFGRLLISTHGFKYCMQKDKDYHHSNIIENVINSCDNQRSSPMHYYHSFLQFMNSNIKRPKQKISEVWSNICKLVKPETRCVESLAQKNDVEGSASAPDFMQENEKLNDAPRCFYIGQNQYELQSLSVKFGDVIQVVPPTRLRKPRPKRKTKMVEKWKKWSDPEIINHNASAFLRRRYSLGVQGVMNGRTIGLLYVDLFQEGLHEVADSLAIQLRNNQKNVMHLSVGSELTVAKLCNFMEVDCWIVLGCSSQLFRILDQQPDYPKPFASPYEACVALNCREWLSGGRGDGGYISSMKDLLSMGPIVPIENVEDGEKELFGQDINPSDDISSLVVERKKDGATDYILEQLEIIFAREEESGASTSSANCDEEHLATLLKSLTQHLEDDQSDSDFKSGMMRISNKSEDATSPIGTESTSASPTIDTTLAKRYENEIFSNTQRGWKGYEDIGISKPAKVQPGMTGIASSYEGEGDY